MPSADAKHPIVSRFAPSPTGALHLGNARTALFAWLAVRASGGRFLLRIEDTDAARAVAGAEAALLAELRWLGLAWDGEVVHQSARAARHAELLDTLERTGKAYPCFCTESELEVARKTALANRRPPRYLGTCASLSVAEVAARRAAGRVATLRFRVPGGWATRFDDAVHGPHEEASDAIGDFVIRRADGVPTFLFANAVDDAEMGVTLVLRGDDHISNTPRQLLLLSALLPAGAQVPRYGHLPLVLAAASDKPLSKRDGAHSVAALREAGWLPLAVVNYLARLGHHGYGEALLPLAELARGFRLDHLGRAPSHFDPAQLEHWQRLAVAALDADAFAAWCGIADPPVPAADRVGFIGAVRGNVLLPADAGRWATALYGAAAPEAEAAAVLAEAGAAFFAAAATALAASGPDYAAFTKALGAATGRKGRALHAPVRAAVTGRLDGPELAQLFPLLGRDRLAARFDRYAR
jgi:nondiscriminating glutamyl-tRNA synthetase